MISCVLHCQKRLNPFVQGFYGAKKEPSSRGQKTALPARGPRAIKLAMHADHDAQAAVYDRYCVQPLRRARARGAGAAAVRGTAPASGRLGPVLRRGTPHAPAGTPRPRSRRTGASPCAAATTRPGGPVGPRSRCCDAPARAGLGKRSCCRSARTRPTACGRSSRKRRSPWWKSSGHSRDVGRAGARPRVRPRDGGRLTDPQARRTASSSSVLAASSSRSPRVSRFTRTSGSVFDGRTLKRHSANSALTPSRRSIASAAGA